MAAIIAIGPAQAVENPALETAFRPEIQKMYKERFAGWTGIGFYCDLTPDDQVTKPLCEWAGQRLRTLALSSRITLNLVSSNPLERGFDKGQRGINPVDLVLEVLANGSGTPLGVSVRLVATQYYGKAVEEGERPSSPRSRPRGGILVLWESSFIDGASSRGPELDATLRQALDTHLMKFISDFAEARQ